MQLHEEVSKIKKEVRSMGDDVSLLTDLENELLYNLARNIQGKGVIVEIGSRKGGSTIFLARGSQAGKKIPVYAIDPHCGTYMHKGFSQVGKDSDTYEEFINNIKRGNVGDIVYPIRKTSEGAVKNWDKKVELLWIDGDHRYEGVKKDFELWWPHLAEEGVVAFHDSTCADVQKFVLNAFSHASLSNAGLVDSITYGVKSSRKANKLKISYVLFLNKMQNLFRILPESVKGPLKLAIRRIIY